MTEQTITDFRWVLRQRTQDRHDRLDALVSRLDLTQAADLVSFFRMHLAAFDAMARHWETDGLTEMREAMAADLSQLSGVRAPDLALASFHPMAGRYILAGSRMGTVLLERRWSEAKDPRVRQAGRYFGLPRKAEDWQGVREALRVVPVGSLEAEEIVSDTRTLFDGFERACRAEMV